MLNPPLGMLNGLNDAQPGQLADMLRAAKLGSILRALPTQLNGKVPLAAAANPYVAAASLSLQLPDDAKAAFVFRAYSRAGTGGTGEQTADVAQTGTATDPGSGHIGISPSGDLVFHGADVPTLVDVYYLPLKYDVVELTLSYATSSAAIPAAYKALLLLEAEVLTGTAPGEVIIDGPGTATASGHAELDAAKTHVIFNVAQAGAAGTARVKLGVYSKVDLDALLEVAPALGAQTPGIYL